MGFSCNQPHYAHLLILSILQGTRFTLGAWDINKNKTNSQCSLIVWHINDAYQFSCVNSSIKSVWIWIHKNTLIYMISICIVKTIQLHLFNFLKPVSTTFDILLQTLKSVFKQALPSFIRKWGVTVVINPQKVLVSRKPFFFQLQFYLQN